MTTISGLPAAAALVGTEVVPGVQSTSTVKMTAQAVAASGPPKLHASTHFSGGTDAIAIAPSQINAVIPITGGGTGQAAKTAAFNALSPVTTKGDIEVRDATNVVRLGVGTDGQVVTADSTQAAGIKWATPSTGSGGQGLTATAVKSGPYTAAANEDVLTDTRTATWSLSLPVWGSTSDGVRVGMTDCFGGLGTGWAVNPLVVLRNGAPAIDGAAADASVTGGRQIVLVKSAAAGGWIVDSPQGASTGSASGPTLTTSTLLVGGLTGEVARTQISKNGDSLAITDFGGYPGGTAASITTAVGRVYALTSAVEWPAGDYALNTCTFTSGSKTLLAPWARLMPASGQNVTATGATIFHYGNGIGGAGTITGATVIDLSAASSASSIAIQAGGASIGTASTLNFTGAGVATSITGTRADINISGGSSSSSAFANMSTLQGTFSSVVANAVNYMNQGSNRIVFVEPGNYNITATQHLTSANHGFVGLGRVEDTAFTSSVANADTFWIDAAVDGSRWENIQFGSGGTGGHCLAFRGGNTATQPLTWINNIRIIGCTFNGFRGTATDTGGNTITPWAVYIWGGLDVLVEDIFVSDTKNGVMIGGVMNASQSNKVYLDRIGMDRVWYQGVAIVAGEGVTLSRSIFNVTGSGQNSGTSASHGGVIVTTGVQVDITDTRFKCCSPTGIAIQNSVGAAQGTVVRVSNCYWYLGPGATHPDGTTALAALDGVTVDSTHRKVIVEQNHFDSIFNRTGGTDIKFIGRSGGYQCSGYVFRDNYSSLNNNGNKADQLILVSAGASSCHQTQIVGNHLGVDVAVGNNASIVPGATNGCIVVQGNAIGTKVANNWCAMQGTAVSPYGLRIQNDGSGNIPTSTRTESNFYFGFTTAGQSLGTGVSSPVAIAADV